MQKIKDYIYYNRKEIIIAIIFLVLLLISIFIMYKKSEKIEEIEVIEIEEKEQNEEIIKELIVVDIKGEVNNPGIYEFEEEKRVSDVINASGGLKDTADTSNINLSEKIYDEMVIIIPKQGSDKEGIPQVESNKEQTDTKISINNGSLSDLMKIKGIGETKAKSIIDYRNTNGKFKSIEEIMNVKGIGRSTFEKIKNYIKL